MEPNEPGLMEIEDALERLRRETDRVGARGGFEARIMAAVEREAASSPTAPSFVDGVRRAAWFGVPGALLVAALAMFLAVREDAITTDSVAETYAAEDFDL